LVFAKVVKIAFWLVKSYDFMSQNMHYGLNRLKKSKMGEIGLKSGEIAKIGWNRTKSRFQYRFCDCAKMVRWNKIPPWSSCHAPIGCTVTRLSSIFPLQSIHGTSSNCVHSSLFSLYMVQVAACLPKGPQRILI